LGGEPVGEVLDDCLNLLHALAAIYSESFGNQLETQVVAIATAIQANAEHDRNVQCSRDLPRSCREFRGRPQELDGGRQIARPASITEHCDERAVA
jgi:hypothetical protein